MKTIQDFVQNFINWDHPLKNHPEFASMMQIDDAEEKSQGVYDFYGDEVNLVKIDIDDLEGFGTICGVGDNKCFDKDVVSFLKERGVNYIISTISTSYPMTIGSCFIPLKSGGRKLENMVGDRDGSLRWEDGCKFNGHYFFESE